MNVKKTSNTVIEALKTIQSKVLKTNFDCETILLHYIPYWYKRRRFHSKYTNKHNKFEIFLCSK